MTQKNRLWSSVDSSPLSDSWDIVWGRTAYPTLPLQVILTRKNAHSTSSVSNKGRLLVSLGRLELEVSVSLYIQPPPSSSSIGIGVRLSTSKQRIGFIESVKSLRSRLSTSLHGTPSTSESDKSST